MLTGRMWVKAFPKLNAEYRLQPTQHFQPHDVNNHNSYSLCQDLTFYLKSAHYYYYYFYY